MEFTPSVVAPTEMYALRREGVVTRVPLGQAVGAVRRRTRGRLTGAAYSAGGYVESRGVNGFIRNMLHSALVTVVHRKRSLVQLVAKNIRLTVSSSAATRGSQALSLSRILT